MAIHLSAAWLVLALVCRPTTDRILQISSSRDQQEITSHTSTEALAIRLPNPSFSKQAKKTKAEGQVVLSIGIGADGTIKNVSVLNGKTPIVDAVIPAVRDSRYLPAMQDGKFVESTKEITIKYDFRKNAYQPEQLNGTLTEPPQELLNDVAAGRILRTGVGSGVNPPRAIIAPDPEYSEEARRERFSGTVLLGVIVGSDGRPEKVWVVRSLGHGLDRQSVEAVKQWKFSPATRNGEPVVVVLNVETSFYLY